MNIISLEVQNFQGIKAISVPFPKTLIKLVGPNGAGKSSAIHALVSALKGKKFFPEEALRHGEEEGSIRVDLGDYYVTWKLTTKDNYLKVVANNDPKRAISSPQSLLDTFVGDIASDVDGFIQKDAKQQMKILLALAGVDPTPIDEEYALEFEKRRDIGREVTRLQGAMTSKTYNQNVTQKTEVSVTELSNQLQEVMTSNQKIVAAEAEVLRLEKLQTEQQRQLKVLQDSMKVTESSLAKFKDALKGKVKKDVSNLQLQISTAEETNEAIRGNADYLTARKELNAAEEAQKGKTTILDSLIAKKKKMLLEAKMPVKGLRVTEDGVYFKDTLLKEVSEGEGYVIGTAISMALNPELKLIRISRWASLDPDNQRRIVQMAEQRGYQILTEMVAQAEKNPETGEMEYPMGIYISEGVVEAVDGVPEKVEEES